VDTLRESQTLLDMEAGLLNLKPGVSQEQLSECLRANQEQPLVVPTTTESVVARDENGRLLPGNTANPAGRPVGGKNKLISVKRKLELAVREGMSADRIKRIIIKMSDMAEDGDVKAARLILDKFISSAGADEDDADAGKSSGITIRIENATFAKTQPPPIDAIYTEIK
jgi:hypothetical protein